MSKDFCESVVKAIERIRFDCGIVNDRSRACEKLECLMDLIQETTIRSNYSAITEAISAKGAEVLAHPRKISDTLRHIADQDRQFYQDKVNRGSELD